MESYFKYDRFKEDQISYSVQVASSYVHEKRFCLHQSR